MTSTTRCRQLGLIFGLSGIVDTVTAQAISPPARCQIFVSQRNRLYFAQAVFGSLSIVMCLAVVAVLYGHNYTRRSLRDRILMGMFAVNVVYSIGLVVPIDLKHTSNDALCGTLVVSPTTFAAGTGLFIGGKYAMVLYELFIVGASLLSLKTGRTELPRWVEIIAHATCVAVGVGLFVGWTAHWTPLVAERANDSREHTPADHEAVIRISDDFFAVVMAFFRGWVAILVVVSGLWCWSRVVLRRLEGEWDEALVDANQQWDRDLWDKGDPHVNSRRMQKRRLLDLRREGYREVAKPLEPYIAVFVVFSVPAIIMATDYCSKNQAAAQQSTSTNPYPCDQVAQLVLSMRSLATAIIYFRHRDRRCELLDFGVLCRKVCRRLRADARWCTGAATGGRAVALGTGGGYRLQFNQDPDEVREFTTGSFAYSSVASEGTGPLHSIHGEHDGAFCVFEDPKADTGAGIAYQLMDDDAPGVADAL